MRDLRYMKYLDPETEIRGTDKIGEAFQVVYGGTILCYGVSTLEAKNSGTSQVRFFVDDFDGGKWHRLRPYFLIVEPADPTKKTGSMEWSLLSGDVATRVISLEKQIEDAERRVSENGEMPGDGFQAPGVIDDTNILLVIKPIITRFRGKQRQQVQLASEMILAGTWQRPAMDGSLPPEPTSPLSERIVFLAKGFRAFGQANASVKEISDAAADDLEAIAKRLPEKPLQPITDSGAAAAESLLFNPIPIGDDLSLPLSPPQAMIQLRQADELEQRWKSRLEGLRDAGQ
jgi:hypothetical protein